MKTELDDNMRAFVQILTIMAEYIRDKGPLEIAELLVAMYPIHPDAYTMFLTTLIDSGLIQKDGYMLSYVGGRHDGYALSYAGPR